MKSSEIRAKFLKFFEERGHAIVASSPLVPANDPTLLFTNSGMVQFKDVFLGRETRAYKRATTSQRSLRAGGKHNDLENVGYTARHHTFFEMLGNFSFGDYFKRDAIRYAWDLLIKVYGLPPEKLWITVYQTDDEAYDVWTKEIAVPKERCIRIGDRPDGGSDNFWQMADTGPCGPCSEIFYDHGPGIAGGPPGSSEAEGDRYIEIWNLVFMQFDRDEAGTLTPLPKPSVDTGMGLERIAAVLQGVHSNYEIDLFQDLIRAAARETATKDLANNSLKVIADHIRACAFLVVDGVIPGNEGRGYVLRRIIRRAIRHGYKLGQKKPFFHRLVADLARTMGEAYPELPRAQERVTQVLKAEEERFAETLENGMKLLEAALEPEQLVAGTFARQFNTRVTLNFPSSVAPASKGNYWCVGGPFEGALLIRLFDKEDEALGRLLALVQDTVGKLRRSGIPPAKANLAVRFLLPRRRSVSAQTRLDGLLNHVAHQVGSSLNVEFLSRSDLSLDGETVFQLYDTFGFPVDLTADIARERGIAIDQAGFDAAMERQREQARAASKFSMKGTIEYSGNKTEFLGYNNHLRNEGKVVALYKDKGGTLVGQLDELERGIVVLDRTPFYAESGGQVGDQGTLWVKGSGKPSFAVEDTQKIHAEVFGHSGQVRNGSIRVGDIVDAQVDEARRARTMRNHSATHLMHKALREVLGQHVQQKGSLVDAEKTRFDFSHDAQMTDEQIRLVEAKVNAEILRNEATLARIMKFDDAVKGGAMALFGEKYGDEVRVLDIGSSRELCGGTHVARTGDIGFFKIVSQSGVAAGIRRVEATTGEGALEYTYQLEDELKEVAFELGFAGVQREQLAEKVGQIRARLAATEKENARLKSKFAASQGEDLAAQAVVVDGKDGAKVCVLAAALDGADAQTLRETLDKLKDKLKSAAIVLGSTEGGKVILIAGVTANLTGKLKAGELVNYVAQQVGGKGGGRPDMAQAGGTEPAKVPAALDTVRAWVAQRL